FSSRRRHTRFSRDWSSDVCSSDLTLKAYQKAMEVYEKAQSGTDFGELAVEYSEDPSAKQNKGYLGYFTVFRMVYPFESAAFETSVGEVSKPVRSRFGYHIIKVKIGRASCRE